MTSHVLRRALECAEFGWPVFPCQPGRKAPATLHGYLDATTDPAQIRAWFTGHPGRNLAVATGAPGPDILDVDTRGPAGNGFAALARLSEAGLLNEAGARVRTPGGGLHVYFAGTTQRSAHLPARHVDFLAQGGYALIPPSRVGGRTYQHIEIPGAGVGGLDWPAAVRLLEPSRDPQRPAPRPAPEERIDALARWVAAQREGNRNAGLFWAANRALETGHAADLSPLAAAARQAGLDEPEISRTLNSARRSHERAAGPPDRQPEGAS